MEITKKLLGERIKEINIQRDYYTRRKLLIFFWN